MSAKLPQSDPSKLPPVWDWSDIPPDSIREIVRQGEVMMADIMTASCASDARASSLSGVFATIAAGLIAASAALTTISKPNLSIVFALAGMSIGFIISGFICFGASRPRDYYTAGNDPALIMNVARYKDKDLLIRETAESLNRKIIYNSGVLSSQTQLTRIAYFVCGASVIAGVLFIGISYFS